MATIDTKDRIRACHIQPGSGSTHQSIEVARTPMAIMIPSQVFRLAFLSALAPMIGQMTAMVTDAREFIQAHSALPFCGETAEI